MRLLMHADRTQARVIPEKGPATLPMHTTHTRGCGMRVPTRRGSQGVKKMVAPMHADASIGFGGLSDGCKHFLDLPRPETTAQTTNRRPRMHVRGRGLA